MKQKELTNVLIRSIGSKSTSKAIETVLGAVAKDLDNINRSSFLAMLSRIEEVGYKVKNKGFSKAFKDWESKTELDSLEKNKINFITRQLELNI